MLKRIVPAALMIFFTMALPAHADRTDLFQHQAENLNTLSSLNAAKVGSGHTHYLHLAGAILNETNDQIFNDLTAAFGAALEAQKSEIRFSYTLQVSGRGQVLVNLALEPAGPADTPTCENFIAALEKKGFKSLRVQFQLVTQIREIAEFQAGMYVANQEDPFAEAYKFPRHFRFANLQEWNDFSNLYGFALLNKDGQAFRKFLKDFIANPKIYQVIQDTVLTKNNMAAIDPNVSLVLVNNTKVDSSWANSPFIPFKFFRNCYAKDYEGGMCYTP